MILFLKPYFEPKVWAGTELNKIYDCKHGTGGLYRAMLKSHQL